MDIVETLTSSKYVYIYTGTDVTITGLTTGILTK
jgi:hypothetical protein